jgi:hypothetical protein
MRPAAAAPLARSRHSFKVLAECPLIVMLLYQTYKSSLAGAINDLVPVMMQSLTVRAPPQTNASLAPRFLEQISCQVRAGRCRCKHRGVFHAHVWCLVCCDDTCPFFAVLRR